MNTDLEKIKHYCAYQERCHQEVRTKLLEMKVYGDELENIIAILIEENFLNEERFAKSYARGKFYQKSWGRNKIKQEMKMKNISETLIKSGMREIDEQDYMDVLQKLATKKVETLRDIKGKLTKFNKVKNYLLQKGYESNLVFDVVRNLI